MRESRNASVFPGLNRLGFELFENPPDQPGGQRVSRDSAGAGDVEPDGLAVQVHQGAAAKPRLQHGVMLDRLFESFGSLARATRQAAEALLREKIDRVRAGA